LRNRIKTEAKSNGGESPHKKIKKKLLTYTQKKPYTFPVMRSFTQFVLLFSCSLLLIALMILCFCLGINSSESIHHVLASLGVICCLGLFFELSSIAALLK
jgi:ABC-type polysaccharide/polyol phosphate export permease